MASPLGRPPYLLDREGAIEQARCQRRDMAETEFGPRDRFGPQLVGLIEDADDRYHRKWLAGPPGEFVGEFFESCFSASRTVRSLVKRVAPAFFERRFVFQEPA